MSDFNSSEFPNSSDCISRQAAIERATKDHDFFRGATIPTDKARRDELLNVMCWLRELPSAQLHWIPCSDRLPKKDGLYLCWCEYYHWSKEKVLPEYGIGYYDVKLKFWGGEVANGKDAKVLAWMPLPDPYKGE